MKELLTLRDFDQAIATGQVIVVTDDDGRKIIHMSSCLSISMETFETKVIKGGRKNGTYYAFESVAKAQREGYSRRCQKCC